MATDNQTDATNVRRDRAGTHEITADNITEYIDNRDDFDHVSANYATDLRTGSTSVADVMREGGSERFKDSTFCGIVQRPGVVS